MFSFQFDFQSSEEEKEKLSAELQRLQSLAHNMDDVMRKSQELCSRLSQQESSQSEDLKVGHTERLPLSQTLTAVPSPAGEVSDYYRPAKGRSGEAGGCGGGVEKNGPER